MASFNRSSCHPLRTWCQRYAAVVFLLMINQVAKYMVELEIETAGLTTAALIPCVSASASPISTGSPAVPESRSHQPLASEFLSHSALSPPPSPLLSPVSAPACSPFPTSSGISGSQLPTMFQTIFDDINKNSFSILPVDDTNVWFLKIDPVWNDPPPVRGSSRFLC